MAEFPVLPFFTDAYLADTRHLTAAQHGAYLLLLMTAWRSTDCRLPDDDNFLARAAAMDTRTWKANKEVVMAFWRKDETQKWCQGRLEDERKNVVEQRSKNVAAGKASALKRKERHSTTVITKPQRESNYPSPSLNPSVSKKENILQKKETEAAAQEQFARFWEAYPRRDGRHKASQSWRRAIDDGADPENLICCAQSYAARCIEMKTERQFIKMPQTWLNGKCWEDEQETVDAANDTWTEADQWRVRMRIYSERGLWPTDVYGARPWEKGCIVPDAVLSEFKESTPSHKSGSPDAV